MRFWDSSAIVPLLVEQPATKRMLELLREDPVITAWWGSRVECDSALARLEREGALVGAASGQAFRRLDLLAAGWQEVTPLDAVRGTARRLLRTHTLRAADALQLAAAWLVAEQSAASLEVVCLDIQLAAIAAREGFAVIEG